jgi:zinc/manganese transport system permease protein
MSGDYGPLEIMALPFAECLILVGIHSYLGLHVLRRKVIFVDLALAQVAALGTTVAFLFGIAPLSTGAYVFSLLFTFVGAAVFSLTRLRSERIPQEAVIGLVYALAAAVGILVVARAPHGAEHITQVLTGVLFYVKAEEVAAAAAVYAAVGLFHFFFRRQFITISVSPERAWKLGLNVRWWDFLFYVTFGIVITHSVRTAGVLLVFVFLVVPAMLALLVTDRLWLQLLIGWGVGTLVSTGGLAISYYADSATGPTVVALYGAVLLVAALALYVVKGGERRLRRLGQVVGGTVVVLALSGFFYGLGQWFGARPEWSVAGEHDHHVHVGEEAAAALPVPEEGADYARLLLDSLRPMDIESRTEHLAEIADPKLLANALAQAPAEGWEMRLVLALRLHDIAPPKACGELATILLQADSGLLRDEALTRLAEATGDDYGYDPWEARDAPSNREAATRWAEFGAACGVPTPKP